MAAIGLSNATFALNIALLQHGWRDEFDAGTLDRGQRYARQQRVDEQWQVELDENGRLTLSGYVSGSLGAPYYTTIMLTPAGTRHQLRTACSCPVGSTCKHAVALIDTFLSAGPLGKALETPETLEYEEVEQAPSFQSAKREWTIWLRHHSQAPAVPSAMQVDANHRLGLFLDVHSGHSGLPALTVQPVWLRPSKSKTQLDRWVSPVKVEVSHAGELSPVPAMGWQPAQEEAIEQLLHGSKDPQWYFPGQSKGLTLNKAFQAKALWSLLASDAPPLLFHQKQTGPRLGIGPTCRIAPTWQMDEQGVQRLQMSTTPEDVLSPAAIVASVGKSLCYLDPQNKQFGPLEGDIELWRQLQHVPALPPEMSEWLTSRLQNVSGLAAQVPSPRTLMETTLEDVKPKLKVTMCVARAHLPTRRHVWNETPIRLGAGVVTLSYAGIEIPPEEGEMAQGLRDGQRLTIPRDQQAEIALIRAIPPGMVTLEELAAHHDIPDGLELPSWSLLLPIDRQVPENAAQWRTCLSAPEEWWDMILQLRQAGCVVEFSDDFPQEPEYLSPDNWYGALESAENGWFDLALGVEVENESFNLLPILRQLIQREDFPLMPEEDEEAGASWVVHLPDNRRLVLPLAKLRAWLAPLMDWLHDSEAPTSALRVPLTSIDQLAPLADHERWVGREDAVALAQRLRELPDKLPAPDGFQGELRDYQARGLAWLRFLSELSTGGILADDMGLGKTIQILAHVLDERSRGELRGPVMVVAPTSLVGNWCAEAARFAPTLSVLALQGAKASRREQIDTVVANVDLVITTYPLLVRDIEHLCEQHFGIVVLDEAQAIKNAASQTARTVRRLNAGRMIAMTGTPLENHLGELWAQLDVAAPGALGSQQWFGRHFRTPIEKHADAAVSQRLSRRISPLILRRTKQQVLNELPDKTETQRDVTLTGAQRELYESLRLTQHQRVKEAIETRGLAASGIVMLDALLKLRQVCCDPRLVKHQSAATVQRSAKLEALRELLPSLVEDGRRILIFSQFTEMLELIGGALEREGISHLTLTGQTPGAVRTERVAQFQRGEVPVFLISLKAGGTGLNLTTADTVIHYDPWWNPAVEAQATGRAHRMGQKNPVFVYKLVCAGTVEERILELQSRKADLAASVLEGGSGRQEERPLFDEEDLALLFAPV